MIVFPGFAQERRPFGDGFGKNRMNMREEMMKRRSSATYMDILGRRDNGPAVGTVAPDFVLEPLKEYDFKVKPQASAGGESGDAVLRLSDFKGHRPVVLLFGSYT